MKNNISTPERQMQKLCPEIKTANECLLIPVVNALELTVEG